MDNAMIAEMAAKAADRLEGKWCRISLASLPGTADDWDSLAGFRTYISTFFDLGRPVETFQTTDQISNRYPLKAEHVDTVQVCMLGAMAWAFYGQPLWGDNSDDNGYDDFVGAVYDYLYRLPGANLEVVRPGRTDLQRCEIYRWNDRTERAEAEVIATLRDISAHYAGLAGKEDPHG